jgi:hypothetical protein
MDLKLSYRKQHGQNAIPLLINIIAKILFNESKQKYLFDTFLFFLKLIVCLYVFLIANL